ncbi:hypothetical protein GC170_14480 [bacterium]|nr:hypothetical protein [bacterium]
MIERRHQAAAVIDVKDAQETGTVRVRAASFLNLDRGRELIVPGAYAKHISRFATKGRVFLDHTHSTAAKVGNVVSAYEDPSGLIAVAKFNATDLGQKTRQQALGGELGDVSIGHQVFKDRFVSPAEVKQIWAKHNYQPTELDMTILSKPGKIRVIDEADAAEFSFVGIPMNDNAQTLEVKGIETKRGAVLSGANAKALKQAYTFIKRILKSARIEDLEEEAEAAAGALPATQGKSTGAETPAADPVETETVPVAEQTGAELRARRLRAELEFLSLSEPAVVAARKDHNTTAEDLSLCPVTQN